MYLLQIKHNPLGYYTIADYVNSCQIQRAQLLQPTALLLTLPLTLNSPSTQKCVFPVERVRLKDVCPV